MNNLAFYQDEYKKNIKKMLNYSRCDTDSDNGTSNHAPSLVNN